MFLNDLSDLPQEAAQRALYVAMDSVTRNSGKQAVVSALIINSSAKRPVLLAIEDIHWAGPETIAQPANLARTMANCRASLVMTSRIEGNPLDRACPGADTSRWGRDSITLFKGDLLLNLGEVEAAMSAYRDAQLEAGDDRAAVVSRVGLAACLRMTSDHQGALDLIEKSELIGLRSEFTVELSRLHQLRGNLYFPLGRIELCREEHHHALEFARAAGSVEDEARALGGLGDAEYGRGRMKSAHEALRVCIERCREHGIRRIKVENPAQMAAAPASTSDCKEALANALLAARSACAVSHDRAEMAPVFVVAHSALSLADATQIEESIHRGQALNEKLKARAFETAWTYLSALAPYLEGERDGACQMLEPSIHDTSAHAFFGPFVFGALSMASTERGTRVRALQEGERLLAEDAMGAANLQFSRSRCATPQAGWMSELRTRQ